LQQGLNSGPQHSSSISCFCRVFASFKFQLDCFIFINLVQVLIHDLFVHLDDLLVVIMYLSPFLITKPIDVLLKNKLNFFYNSLHLNNEKINKWHKFAIHKMYNICVCALLHLCILHLCR